MYKKLFIDIEYKNSKYLNIFSNKYKVYSLNIYTVKYLYSKTNVE